jgi:hypothetical protein
MQEKGPATNSRSETRTTGPRRFQLSLWARLALAALIPVVLVLAAIELGWVDAAVILLALVVLAWMIRRPEPVRLTTAIVLTLVAGMLLWANLRRVERLEQRGVEKPQNLDGLTEAMFWRGWPLCPFMFSPYVSSFRYITEDQVLQRALIYDGAVYVAALFATRFLCERCFRRRRSESAAAPSRRQPARPPLVSLPTKGLFLAIGFGLLDLTFWSVAIRYSDAGMVPVIQRIERFLHAPAYWLRDRWLDALSPLANMELARNLVPLLTVLIQWGLIGFVLGIWISLNRRERKLDGRTEDGGERGTGVLS